MKIVLLNSILPSVFIEVPLLVLSLIPIVFIEYLVFIKLVKTKNQVLKTIIIANIASTIIGVPLAYLSRFLLLLCYFIDEETGDKMQLYLMFGQGLTWLGLTLITNYFFSVWSEYLVSKKMLRGIEQNLIFSATWKVNLISYVCLGLSAYLAGLY